MQATDHNHHEIGLLIEQNLTLKTTLASFKTSIDSLTETISHQKQYILQLEEFIRHGRRQQFGASSEQLADLHPSLFDEPEAASEGVTASVDEGPEAEAADQPKPARKPRKAVRIPPELPRVEIIHDLPDAQKVCPHDGTVLKHIDSEIHEQLDIIPAQVQVLRHIRYTYACPCCEQHVVTAQKPKQPIEKSMASPRLLATIATQKYVDGMPLYRQEQTFARIGLELDRTTQANWMMKCGALIQPLINLIQEQMLEEPVLHMDETRVQVLTEPGRSPQSQSYMWVLRSVVQPAVLFHYAPTRSSDIPKQLLADFSGALMVDGYEGYHAVCATPAITRLGCWAHVRRGFVDAKKAYGPGKTGKADEALVHIAALYRIEHKAKDKPPEERLALRQEHSAGVIASLKQWLDKNTSQIAPKSLLGKAMHYLNHQWPHLTHFLEDGDYPIDNNFAENAIRPFVIGRKNWLFSASQRGADASANLYSLIETAKANGLEPNAYLTHIFTELPNANTLEDLEALLPWAIKNGKGGVR
jgi:transposase